MPLNQETSLLEIYARDHKCTPREEIRIFIASFLKYLFIYLAVPGLSHGTRDLHCGTWDLQCSVRDLCCIMRGLWLWHADP